MCTRWVQKLENPGFRPTVSTNWGPIKFSKAIQNHRAQRSLI